MKRILFTLFAAFLFGVCVPTTFAQETENAIFATNTSVPTQTAPDVASTPVVAPVVAPVVVTETPDATDADTLGFWQIAIHLINAGVALAIVFFLYHSVPADTRAKLDATVQAELKAAETRAKATETYFDDLFVEAAKRGYKLVKAEAEKTEEPKAAVR